MSCRVLSEVDHPVFWFTVNHTEKITGFCSFKYWYYRTVQLSTGTNELFS